MLGRPGAVLLGGEIAGLWRPRKSGKSFRVNIELWVRGLGSDRKAITEQAEGLAAHRHVVLSGMDIDD